MDPKLKALILNEIGGLLDGDEIAGREITGVELANEFNDVTLLVTSDHEIFRLTVTLVTPLATLPKTEDTVTKI